MGVNPSKMEVDYGWIKKGQELGWSNGVELRSVGSFKEKPTSPFTWSTQSSGWLWNTMVVIAKLKTLWTAGWRTVPMMMERFSAFEREIGTQREGKMLEAIYDDMPHQNFSSDLLAQSVKQLGVMEIPNVLWSDWGRPERIIDTLSVIGREPIFSNNQYPSSHNHKPRHSRKSTLIQKA